METLERTCCAIGCGNQGVLPFPKNEVVRKKWELALMLQNGKTTKNSRLCVDHFKPTDFIHKEVITKNGLKLVSKTLKKGVIPTSCYKDIKTTSFSHTKPPNNVYMQKIKSQNLDSLQQVNRKSRLLKKYIIPIENDKKGLNKDKISTLHVSKPHHQAKKIKLKNNTVKYENAKEGISLAMEVEEETHPEIEYLDMEDFCTQDEEVSPKKHLNSAETSTKSPAVPKNKLETINKPVYSQVNSVSSYNNIKQSTKTNVCNNSQDRSRIGPKMQAVNTTKQPHKYLVIVQKLRKPVSNENMLRTQQHQPEPIQRTTLQSTPPVNKSTITPAHVTQAGKPPYNQPSDDNSYEKLKTAALRTKLLAQLKKIKKEYHQHYKKVSARKLRLKKLKNIMTHPHFLKYKEKMAPIPKILILCQLRLVSKKSKGRRFSEEEKKLAQSLYAKNPTAYRYMLKIGFILPSEKYLNAFDPVGSTDNRDEAIKKLKDRMDALKPMERLCTLMFKEEILRPENRKQKIVTSIDSDNEVVLEADHALLFMVRSVTSRYKEPVSYTFSYGPTAETELAAHIKNVITDLQILGLTVVATVCAHTDTNRRAIQILINEAKCDCLMSGQSHDENVFIVNNKPIVTIYDPPHLLRGIRNHFMTKDVMYITNGKSKVAKWRYLEMVVKENPEMNGERAIPKLTESLVYPSEDALNVTKYAAQVFSQTVASYMGYLAERAILSPESQNTADLLLFFDQLFDSVNGFLANTNRKGKPLLYACKKKSPHTKVWTESIQVLKTMKFLQNGCLAEVPEIECWIWTLKSFMLLVNSLNMDYKVPKVWPRNINQDMLERVFRMEVNPKKKGIKKCVTRQNELPDINVPDEVPKIDDLSNGNGNVNTQKAIKTLPKYNCDGKMFKHTFCVPNKENSPICNIKVLKQEVINRPMKIDLSSHFSGKVVKQYGRKNLHSQPKVENSECQTKVPEKVIQQPKIENSSAVQVEYFISQNPVLKLPSLPILEV